MIKEKADIINTLESEGLELKKRGQVYWAYCPFHVDKTPSFKADPQRQNFYCFGCGEHGDVIDFVMKLHNIGFKDALQILGIKKGQMPKPDPQNERRRQLKKAYEQWQKVYYWHLCNRSIELWDIKIKAKNCQRTLPEWLAFMVAEAISALPRIAYHLDILSGQDEELKFELFKEVT